MSLFRWREKRRIAELEERDQERVATIDELREALASSRRDPGLAKRREAAMASRIVSLETALKRTQQQLDDAMGTDQAALALAGRLEQERRTAKAGDPA